MTLLPQSTHSPNSKPTQLPGLFQRYRSDLTQGLRDCLSGNSSKVYDMLRYFMGWTDVEGNPTVAVGGTALRPTLCLFACEAVGGSVKQAMPAAVALELIHIFSLIHDDIQDRDEIRRHRPTLWAVWGIPKSLEAGNVLRVVADSSLRSLVSEGVTQSQALAGVNLLTQAYLEMIEGQYLDLSYEGRPDIGMQDYLTMISRKTGALIRCSLHLGAAIGTRDEATMASFRECGRALGYVFQIRDDYLGIWGDESSTGKPVGADIRRKKNSFPVVYAMSQAKGKDKAELQRVYELDEVDEDDVARVLEGMARVNARE